MGGRGLSWGCGISVPFSSHITYCPASLIPLRWIPPPWHQLLHLSAEQVIKAPVICFSAAVPWASITRVRSHPAHTISSFPKPTLHQVLFPFSIPAHPHLQPSFLQSTILISTSPRQKDFLSIMLIHHGHGTEPILQFTLLWALFSFSPSQDGADFPNLLPGFLPLVSIALPCSQTQAVLCLLQVKYGNSGCTGSSG